MRDWIHTFINAQWFVTRREISSKLVLPFDQTLSKSKVTVVFPSILLILITRRSFKSLIPYYKKPTGSKVVTQIAHFDVSQFQTLMAAATFQTKGRGWDGQKRYKGMGLLTFSTSTDLNFLCAWHQLSLIMAAIMNHDQQIISLHPQSLT